MFGVAHIWASVKTSISQIQRIVATLSVTLRWTDTRGAALWRLNSFLQIGQKPKSLVLQNKSTTFLQNEINYLHVTENWGEGNFRFKICNFIVSWMYFLFMKYQLIKNIVLKIWLLLQTIRYQIILIYISFKCKCECAICVLSGTFPTCLADFYTFITWFIILSWKAASSKVTHTHTQNDKQNHGSFNPGQKFHFDSVASHTKNLSVIVWTTFPYRFITVSEHRQQQWIPSARKR